MNAQLVTPTYLDLRNGRLVLQRLDDKTLWVGIYPKKRGFTMRSPIITGVVTFSECRIDSTQHSGPVLRVGGFCIPLSAAERAAILSWMPELR